MKKKNVFWLHSATCGQTRSGRKWKWRFLWEHEQKRHYSYIYSSVFNWLLNYFFLAIKYFETNLSAKSTYLIGATLLPLTSSFFSWNLCTSVSSRHSKFLSIFLLIIWFFQTLLLKFSEKLKRYKRQCLRKLN